jgi:Zn-dependent peptidase ImmA (M78 family)
MIFSAAHELGHILLHKQAFDVAKTKENSDEEIEANVFAGHLLMPNAGFDKEWSEALGTHWVDRVFKIKKIFHVSYKTVLMRLIENGHVDNSIWQKFYSAYLRRYNKKLLFREEPLPMRSGEPYSLDAYDFYEERFGRLVRRAIEEEKISLSRGAEMLRIKIGEMQERLKDWD